MPSSKTDKSKVKETTFRNWALASDFEIKVVDGINVEALCIPCSSISENRQVAFTYQLYKPRRTKIRQSDYKIWQIGEIAS